MINLIISKPSPKLAKFVRRIFFVKLNEKQKHRQKVISNPFVYLSFVPNKPPIAIVGKKKDPILHKLYFTGPIKSEEVILEYSGKIEHLFFEFTPAGFYSLFHTSPKLFIDQLLPLNGVISVPEYNELLNKVALVNKIESKQKVIEEFLLGRAKNSHLIPNYISDALDIIEENNGYIPVERIVKKLKISDRQFRRKFNQVIGLSPKVYCEILNAHFIITNMQQKNYKSIQDLANNSHYYDLAHFCNRFKKIMGFKPTEFMNSNMLDFSKSMYGTK